MKINLNDGKSYNTIKDLLLYNIMLTIAKSTDVKIMNNVSRKPLD